MAEQALRLGLIGDPRGWHLQDVARAGKARGHEIAIVPWTNLASVIEAGREQFLPRSCTECDALVIHRHGHHRDHAPARPCQ